MGFKHNQLGAPSACSRINSWIAERVAAHLRLPEPSGPAKAEPPLHVPRTQHTRAGFRMVGGRLGWTG